MKFKKVFIKDAFNKILAHSINSKELKIKKGKILDSNDIDLLKENSINKVYVAVLEKNDLHENKVAENITKKIVSKEILKVDAKNGRADFFSKVDGMLVINLKQLISLNYYNPSIAVSALKQYTLVKRGQLLGNVKIIPYALHKSKLDKIIKNQNYRNIFSVNVVDKQNVTLILSLENINQDIKKIESSIAIRLKKLNLKLNLICKVNHDIKLLTQELKKHLTNKRSLILIYGSTSITDLKDVIPSAIRNIQGKIISLGAPTDPGNLLMIASKNKNFILGVPGCAKSILRNGFDLVLERICHGIIFNKMMVAEMSEGGLFKELIRNLDKP